MNFLIMALATLASSFVLSTTIALLKPQAPPLWTVIPFAILYVVGMVGGVLFAHWLEGN